MRYTSSDMMPKEDAPLRKELETVLKGLGFSLVELVVSRHRGSVQIKVVIYSGESISTDDCSKVHRAIAPRLELTLHDQDVYIEVSSPGIDRLIKDGVEFLLYTGKAVKCFRSDISDWTSGILEKTDEKGIVLKTDLGAVRLEFDIITKAKLDSSYRK